MIHTAFEFVILLLQPPEQPYIKIVVYLSGYSFKGIPRIRVIEKKFTTKQALTEGPVLAWWQTPGVGVEKKPQTGVLFVLTFQLQCMDMASLRGQRKPLR